MTEHGKKHEVTTETVEPTKVEQKDTVTISKEEYEKLLKSKEAQEKLLYVYAEFDNFKKRTARDLQQQMAYANENLIKEVLPIIDNLCRAVDADNVENCKSEETAKESLLKFVEGIKLIEKQFTNVLEKFGVEVLQTKGEKFDPNFHEAMDQVESKDHEHGDIVSEYQKGYKLKDRVIRPSKVLVATKKKKEEE